jgi:hypothetical protein
MRQSGWIGATTLPYAEELRETGELMKKDLRCRPSRALPCEIWGWALFAVCALFFMAAGWPNRDMLTLVGSILFLVACLLFLIPLLRSRAETRKKADESRP